MKRIRTISASLTLLILAGLIASCGDTSNPGGDGGAKDSQDGGSVSADTEPAYDYGTLDLNGDDFVILNTAQTYGFYGSLDFETATGDTLDDSIYERNRAVEDRYNFKLVVNEEYSLDKAAAALQTAVLAGDDVYDVAFLRDYYMTTALTEGYLQNLDDYPEMQLNKPWWDGAATENARIGKTKKALFAMTDVSLVDFEGTMVAFFNEDMLADLGLDLPYQMVLDGKWTFAELCKYSKAAAKLNGDDAFEPFLDDGSSIYGHVGFQHTYNALIISAGNNYITRDKDANLAFGLDNERFYNVAIKLSESFANNGEWHFGNSGVGMGAPGHYETTFKNGRALFTTAQFKAANGYRDMTATYGVVPIPKWDESQEDYVSLRTFSYLMSIPVTNQRGHETGRIMDAMSYITYNDIMPYFYEGRISQKQLRNEESIEMMNIIRNTRYIDLGSTYGLFNTLSNRISDIITNKSTDFASMIASEKPGIEETITKLMDAMNE